ncbi:hypothetical protein EX30DRAFT_382133 [Ascodesmis nigricans]|uniref:Uncharacterized protein n=1 Tax=Ascodesmis nigricans TaxID=341454 RepID=A0A4S2MQG4_9PEZI|nr:hypothetical protein EX30DRAFT_382133 [Ascodesmis nigricans]
MIYLQPLSIIDITSDHYQSPIAKPIPSHHAATIHHPSSQNRGLGISTQSAMYQNTPQPSSQRHFTITITITNPNTSHTDNSSLKVLVFYCASNPNAAAQDITTGGWLVRQLWLKQQCVDSATHRHTQRHRSQHWTNGDDGSTRLSSSSVRLSLSQCKRAM